MKRIDIIQFLDLVRAAWAQVAALKGLGKGVVVIGPKSWEDPETQPGPAHDINEASEVCRRALPAMWGMILPMPGTTDLALVICDKDGHRLACLCPDNPNTGGWYEPRPVKEADSWHPAWQVAGLAQQLVYTQNLNSNDARKRKARRAPSGGSGTAAQG